jgi:hypothetical protein
LVFPVGLRRCASALADCRSAGGSGRPRVDLVTAPLLRRQRAGSRGPFLASLPEGSEVRSGLLSWGSKIAPPPISMLCVHSRVGRGLPFGSEAPTSVLVPSLSFHPTPTVYSAQHRAGLLHPATGHGVRHVSVAVSPPRPEGCGGVAATFPMAHTLRSFSLPGSWSRVTTVLALSLFLAAFPCLPRALPLAFGPVWRVSQPQGFEPPRSPLRATRRCR